MKGIDIFCASQASTAIRRLSTMDEITSSSSSSSSSSTAHLSGGRAIDRHNPIIRDPRRLPLPPCTSDAPPPVNPIPYKQLHHKNRKSNDQISTNITKKSAPDQKKKSQSEKATNQGEIVKKGLDRRGDLMINGPDSSRYLLGETGSFDLVSDFDPVLGLVAQPVKTEESSASNSKPSSSSSSSSSSNSSRSPDQVVVLKVSLHCKGCEGKVRKHISRMQGVTSFNIDFAAKKVTVVGDVTPLGVLASVSKVKTAQLWIPPPPPPPMASSLPPAASSNYSEIKKSKAVVAI